MKIKQLTLEQEKISSGLSMRRSLGDRFVGDKTTLDHYYDEIYGSPYLPEDIKHDLLKRLTSFQEKLQGEYNLQVLEPSEALMVESEELTDAIAEAIFAARKLEESLETTARLSVADSSLLRDAAGRLKATQSRLQELRMKNRISLASSREELEQYKQAMMAYKNNKE